MSKQCFIQMSGAPGAGKSTIAHAIAPHIGAVVLDHDITKSALLDADISITVAGKASYLVLEAMAQHLLGQGFSVIFDSPCFYEELLERGQRLAREANAPYFYIECVLKDLVELDRRLKGRPSQRSQVRGLNESPVDVVEGRPVNEALFRNWIAHMKRPQSNYLVLNTDRPLEICVQEALAYVKG